MAEKVGVFNKLYLSAGASDASYTELEFLDGSSIGLQEQFADSNGMTGSRTRTAARTRQGIRQVGGTLNFQPTPLELDLLLPWALGGTKSTNSIPLAETVPARWLKTYRDGVYHIYDGVKVESITFQCSEGSLLSVSLSVVGIDEAESVAPTTPTAFDVATSPYIMHDAVATVSATAYPFRSYQLSLSNGLEVRHNNSQTPTSIHATGRQVSVGFGLPYGDASALYGSAVGGVAVVATFTNGNRSLVLSTPKVQVPRTPLPFGSRGALNLDWTGTARGDGTTAGSELAVSNDSTG